MTILRTSHAERNDASRSVAHAIEYDADVISDAHVATDLRAVR